MVSNKTQYYDTNASSSWLNDTLMDGTPLVHTMVVEDDEDILGSKSRSYSRLNLGAFFIFGLVNNVIYVIFLSAADDLLRNKPNIGKSSVLLADIIPCILVKLIAPYFVRIIPYGLLVAICVSFSFISLSIVAIFDPIWLKFFGIILASASSGLGETSFLALTTYYNPKVVVAWSSGTGAAGIVGAIYYLILSTLLGLGLRAILLIACLLPILMAIAYQFILRPEHEIVYDEFESDGPTTPGTTKESSKTIVEEDFKVAELNEDTTSFKARIKMIHPLILRYVIPLFLVYYAEYTINNSVYFSLKFPLDKTPFHESRQHYPTYLAIYQTGVFISRTLGRLFPINNTWIFASLQIGMLIVLSLETIYGFIDNIYPIFFLILFEGLLGGAAYVNIFCNITHQVPKSQVEFSMAFTGIADSVGIGLAGVTCLLYEPFLCRHNPICSTNRKP